MRLLLVDAPNLAMRAIHAMAKQGLTNASGVPTGPLLAFINGIGKHVREERPDRVVVCWDGGRSAFRVKIDPEYKGHRIAPPEEFENYRLDTFGLIKRFCVLANLFQIERKGEEADDLIASYVAAREPQDTIVILSSDHDFLQLLGPQVEQVRLSSANVPTDRWTEGRVVEEYRCEPRHLAYAMAIAGDAGDNVIGAPRYGMKTAIKALAKHDFSLNATLTEEVRLAPHMRQVLTSYLLVNLVEPEHLVDVPAPPRFVPTDVGSLVWPSLMQFLLDYEMNSVIRRIYDETLWREGVRGLTLPDL